MSPSYRGVTSDMCQQTSKLVLVTSIKDRFVRDRINGLLEELVSSRSFANEVAQDEICIVPCQRPQDVFDELHSNLAQPTNCSAMLFSDSLVETAHDQNAPWIPTPWSQELRQAFSGRYVSIAVAPRKIRVQDIDRVIPNNIDRERLSEILSLCSQKLAYMLPAKKRPLPNPVTIRPIRHLHEMREYFMLRHKVYSAMGYMEPSVEDAESKMEIDWCDTISIHIGAFESLAGNRQELVGAARVVVTSAPSDPRRSGELGKYYGWIFQLTERDEMLRDMLLNRVLALELPIFHSRDFTPDMRRAFSNEICAELSRVVVRHDRRGAGLSRELVKEAIIQATKIGASRMFLECLDVHEEFYRSVGFAHLLGNVTVISVNKTMVGMELMLRSDPNDEHSLSN